MPRFSGIGPKPATRQAWEAWEEGVTTRICPETSKDRAVKL